MPCIRPLFILLLDVGTGRRSEPNFLRQLTTSIPLGILHLVFCPTGEKYLCQSLFNLEI
jgi:hypothetical protein